MEKLYREDRLRCRARAGESNNADPAGTFLSDNLL